MSWRFRLAWSCTCQVFRYPPGSRFIQVRRGFVRRNNQEFGAAVHCADIVHDSEREERHNCTVVSDSDNVWPCAVHSVWTELHNGWFCCCHWHKYCRMVRDWTIFFQLICYILLTLLLCLLQL